MKDNMINKHFGRLTVKARANPPEDKPYAKDVGKWYSCDCSCGKTNVIVPKMSLLNKSTSSCGCLRKELRKERMRVNRKIMIQNGNTTRPTTKVHMIEFEGKKQSMSDWAKEIGITKQALSKRMKSHSIEKALTMKGRINND